MTLGSEVTHFFRTLLSSLPLPPAPIPAKLVQGRTAGSAALGCTSQGQGCSDNRY